MSSSMKAGQTDETYAGIGENDLYRGLAHVILDMRVRAC